MQVQPEAQPESDKAEEYKVLIFTAALTSALILYSYHRSLMQNATLQLQEAASDLQTKRELRANNLASNCLGKACLSAAAPDHELEVLFPHSMHR